MRRALIRVLGGAVLLGAGVLVGAGLVSRNAPRELHAAVEGSLSEALGAPVTIQGTRLLVSRPKVFGIPDVAVEATGVRAWGSGEAAAFSAGRLEARLDATSLVSGRLRFSSVALDDVRLTLERRPDGSWEPPLLSPGFESPVVVLGRVFAGALPAPVVEVRSGALSIVDRGAPSAGTPRRFDLDQLTVKLLAPRLLQTGRLVVSGDLRETGQPPTRFELESVAAASGLPSFEVATTGLSLQRILPYLRAMDPGLELSGLTTGVLGLAQNGAGETYLALDLRVAGFQGGKGDADGIAIDDLAMDADFHLAADSVTLAPGATLRAEGIDLSLEGSLALPVDADAALSFEAKLSSLDRPGLTQIASWLPKGAGDALEHAARSLVAGRLVDLSLAGSTTKGAIEESFADGRRLLPAGVRLEAGIDEVVVQAEGDAPVVASAGHARLEGPDTLVVSGLEGRLGDRPLPILDLRLTGLGHLLEAEAEPVGDAPPIPGIWALQEMLAPSDPDAEPLAWTSLEVEADWVVHPIFLRPLYGLRVRMEPTPEGIALEVAEATWGGLPIRGKGLLETGLPGHAKLEIAVDPAGEIRQKATSEAISRGRIVFERPPKPGLYAHTIRTGFDLTGSRLTLFDASGAMNVRGRIGGDAQLELDRDGEVGAAIRVFVTEADVPDVLAALSDDPANSSGSIDIKARLDGLLRPGTSALRTLSGDLRVTASHGELGIDLPVLLAIAKASTTFNPFGSARGIRFDEIDAELELRAGQLSTRRSITLESPDLRLVLSGTVDLREKPNRLEAVVGCFFFQPLDRMIGLIPVVSRIVLGPDNSLFGTYFELTGSWESPKAGLIPMKTLALGPASFLLEDVPAFVQRGVAAVGEALAGPGPKPPAVASPADAEAGDNGS